MTTLKAAIRAWNQYALDPEREDWDIYTAVMARYGFLQDYHDNTIYTALLPYAARHKEYRGLYKHIRPIINPIKRLADLYVANIYGGALDYEKLQRGAIQVAQLDDKAVQALVKVYQYSHWAQNKGIYVRHGAVMGDAFLKVVDDPERGQVRIEVLDPRMVKYFETDAVGLITKLIIEYTAYTETPINPTGDLMRPDSYTYTEYIDPTQFATYKDGKPFAFNTDKQGQGVAEWDNEYGFVPVFHVKHQDVGRQRGMCAFFTELVKIDEINDAASLVNDQVRKAINVSWYVGGASGPTSLDVKGDNKDEAPVIYGPAGSQPVPLIANIDIAAASANWQHLYAILQDELPELSLATIRATANLTAPGVRAAYKDAIDRFNDAAGNYDATLVRANMAALAIGGMRSYPGLQGFGIEDYTNGNLLHYIQERSIVQDEIDKATKLAMMQSSGVPAKAIWSELGFSDEQVAEWEAERQQQDQAQEALVNAQMDALAKGNMQDRMQGQGQLPAGQQDGQQQIEAGQ